MTIQASKKELQQFITQKHEKCSVAVLPDFFLDRIVNLNWDFSEFSTLIADVAKHKGGSIDGIPQTDMRGGNAMNVASALANLGAKVTPIVCTNRQGLYQIEYFSKGTSIDTSHVKVKEKASITTALEFRNKDEKTNVMIRDLGSLADFGPQDLDEGDYSVIEKADFTCLFNWAGTSKHGTDLAQSVFARARKGGKSKTYYDTADPKPNKNEINNLIAKIFKSNLLDALSVNENEAVTYAGFFDKTIRDEEKQLGVAELAMQSARLLARNLQARIDLHTTSFSATLRARAETVIPAFRVNVLRATGAGDSWTAGNILGEKNGLSDECRLMLANAVAACYLSDVEGNHPTWKKLSRFLNGNV